MDVITLLATTVRLLDLHDSDRDYGSPSNYTREDRPGQSDGVYLDVALSILKRLRELDESARHAYLPIDTILRAVKHNHPEVDEIDIRYVLNVLRRPTELTYLTTSTEGAGKVRHSEKRKTALVEKTDYADEYRLSSTGRLTLTLAQAVRDPSYIRGDAYNLLQAVEWSDFDKVMTFADEIVGRLRGEILDVQAALEKVGRSEAAAKYVDRFDRYTHVIEQTLEIVQKAERELENPNTLDAFEKWQDTHDADLSFEGLCNTVFRIRQVLLRFNRLLFELISTVLQDHRTAAPPPSFLSLALHWVKSPPKPDIEEFLLRQWGALGLETPFHSALDGLAAVKVRRAPDSPEPLVFDEESIESISRLGKLTFLDRHGTAIAEALQQGPIRLSDAIERGWCLVDNRIMLGDLVGVFVAPDALPIEEPVRIGVIPGLKTKSFSDGDFLFTDLELSLGADRE
jgi:hypothetical protein